MFMHELEPILSCSLMGMQTSQKHTNRYSIFNIYRVLNFKISTMRYIKYHEVL